MYIKKLILFSVWSLVIISFNSCNSSKKKNKEESNITSSNKININKSNCRPNSYSYGDMKAYHKNSCLNSKFPLEYKFDLNKDTVKEALLLLDEGSRSGRYILYTKKQDKWKIISDNNFIFANHMTPQVDTSDLGEWKKFSTYENHNELSYIWDGKVYKQK